MFKKALLVIILFLAIPLFIKEINAQTQTIGLIREDCTGYSNCFTSLNDWETNYGGIDFTGCTDGDLVCADVIAVAEIDGTWTNPDTAQTTIDGWTTDATHYIDIHTTAAARHNGTYSTNAYRIEPAETNDVRAIQINEDYVRIDGIQAKSTVTGSINSSYIYYMRGQLGAATSDIRISNCIAVGNVSGSVNYHGGIVSSGVGSRTVRAWNNIMYDFRGSLGSAGIWINNASDIGYVYNNTIHSCSTLYGIFNAGNYLLIKNNIVNDCANDYGGTWSSNSAQNITDKPPALSNAFGAKWSIGTTNSDSEGKLIDSGATFQADGVKVGSMVKNTTDTTYGYVVSIDSETQLTLDSDIFPDGDENYEVYKNIYRAVIFNSEANNDFHLSASDTGALEYGADLSSDANLAFSNDIDGDTRSGNWDIGADEAPAPFCGDGFCNGGETCSTCATDCGICPDVLPPTRTNGSPTGSLSSGTTQTSISLTTDENAICKYSLSSGVLYSSMENTFSVTGGENHSSSVSGLSSGNSYIYYVKCMDGSSNENTTDYQISFSVREEGSVEDVTPPDISGVESDPSSNSCIIKWVTDEQATTQVEYGPNQNYGYETIYDPALVSIHGVALTELLLGTEYHYRVKSKDSSDNLSISDDYSFTTSLSEGEVSPAEISGVSSSVSGTSVEITWKTDIYSAAYINYGLDDKYGLSTEKSSSLSKDHIAIIKDLSPLTEYHYQVSVEDINGNKSASEDFSFITGEFIEEGAEGAAVSPVISGIYIISVGPASAKIEWKTNIPSTSQILFGTESGKLNQTTSERATLETSHSVIISDLSPKTVYYFIAVSRDGDGNKGISSENKFQTSSLEMQTIIEVKKEEALSIGSPGTQIPKTIAGETATFMPIKPTAGDNSSPNVILLSFDENPTQNTSPRIRGRATDRNGVIAGISYSTDNGSTWHPITNVSGIGSSAASFSADIVNLKDGNYPVLFKARDNSGNIGISESRTLIIDVHPPATGANVFLIGAQSIVPSEFGTLSSLEKIIKRMVISAVGGAVSVDVISIKENTETTFPLTYSKPDNLWYGDIYFKEAGNYQLKIKAVDGAGRTSERFINSVVISGSGSVKNNKTKEPVFGAKVSVYQYSPEIDDYVLWPAEAFNQINPQVTDEKGSYRFIVPPGKYYLKVEKYGYRTFYTEIMESSSHESINFDISIIPRKNILGLYLPSFPDFFGEDRISRKDFPDDDNFSYLKDLIGKPAPLFELDDSSGNTVDLRYLRGKNTILTFWSTWSPLSQVQIPILDKFHKEEEELLQRYSVDLPKTQEEFKKAMEDLRKAEENTTQVLLLSMHQSEGIIETYLKRGKYTIPSIIDTRGILAELYPVFTFPQHFFLDRKGIIRDVYVGFLNQDELREKAEEIR